MEEFLDKKYVLKTSENFEDYLVYIGKGYIQRKFALNLSQYNWLTCNADGTYTFHFKSPVAESKITFTSGEEVEETKPDGVKVKALITIQDNKMFHTQTEENGRVSKHVRVFSPDSMTTVKYDKVTTTAYIHPQYRGNCRCVASPEDYDEISSRIVPVIAPAVLPSGPEHNSASTVTMAGDNLLEFGAAQLGN